MKKFLKDKSNIILVIFIIMFGVIFFSYNITLTWDSSEYIGMASSIGEVKMNNVWVRTSWFYVSAPFKNFYAIWNSE